MRQIRLFNHPSPRKPLNIVVGKVAHRKSGISRQVFLERIALTSLKRFWRPENTFRSRIQEMGRSPTTQRGVQAFFGITLSHSFDSGNGNTQGRMDLGIAPREALVATVGLL